MEYHAGKVASGGVGGAGTLMETNGDKCEACGGPVDAECGCVETPQHKLGDCSACHDEDVILVMSEQEDEPLHYICKECHFRGL